MDHLPKPNFTSFQKRLIGAILTLAVLSVGLTVGTFLVLGPQDVRQRASTSGVDFQIIAPTSVSPGSTFTADVFMRTNANQVTAIDLSVAYDNALFQLIGVDPKEVFNVPSNLKPTQYPPSSYPEVILYPVQSGDPYYVNPTIRANANVTPVPTGGTMHVARIALGVPCDRCYLGPSPSPNLTPQPTPVPNIPQCLTSPVPKCYPYTHPTPGGQINIATLTFQVRAGVSGNTALQILPSTQAAAIGSDTDVTLDRVPSQTITVQTSTPPTVTPAVGVITACDADINASGRVDVTDYNYLKSFFFQTCATVPSPTPGGTTITVCHADINNSGRVDVTDYNHLKSLFFQTCP